MLKNNYSKGVFDPLYIGPYTVERRSRSGTYVLRDGTGDILDRRVPADQLKLVSRTAMPREAEAPIYELEEIIEHRGEPGSYDYLVQWKGYAEQTWEPEHNMINCQRAINEYWARQEEIPQNSFQADSAEQQQFKRGGRGRRIRM